MAEDTLYTIVWSAVKTQLRLTDDYETLIQSLYNNARPELQMLLGIFPNQEVPDDLAFILINVIKTRYNTLGSEGFSSESQDGYSFSKFGENDFAQYQGIINTWRESQQIPSTSAFVQFIGKTETSDASW